MQLGKTLRVTTRTAWRQWLTKHHATAKEIWLVYYKKKSGKPRIPYNDAVEEALCFGWIDSTVKKLNEDSFAQRFTPRKQRSTWSMMNKERVYRLLRRRKMTAAGIAAAEEFLEVSAKGARRARMKERPFRIPPDILAALKRDRKTWNNFRKFPESYKRIRIGWIDDSRERPDIFLQRLRYFLAMTERNRRFGMVQ